MIYVAYNSKLEQSFILDKYADFEIKKSKWQPFILAKSLYFLEREK